MNLRPWQVRLKPYVENSIHSVFMMAGMAVYGPKSWSVVAVVTWGARWALLRAIWRHEDARDDAATQVSSTGPKGVTQK